MTTPRHLLFPVETINRGLDFRLALAVLCARPDNRIFIGRHDTLMRLARRVRGGVYLGKDAIRPHFPDALDDYRLLKQRDFVFVHFDTEGAVYPGGERRWRQILHSRLDPRHLQQEDYVCTWGDFQRDVYRGLDPACADNIRTTGHPRFDLYNHRWREFYAVDAAELRSQFGDFILINTNLARANNRLGEDFVFSRYNGFRPRSLESRLNAVFEWADDNRQLSHFVRLVHRLSVVLPDVPVVVRPHPSEDRRFYRLVFRGIDSVHVLHEGPVAPWLLACSCMIHDGCTTGLEGHLGDARVINYRPVDDPLRELFLPNQFGVRCETEDQVVDLLVELFCQGDGRTSFDDPTLVDHRARRLLNNLSGEAFPAMMAVLSEAQSQVDDPQAPPELLLRLEEGMFEVVEDIKDLLRPLSKRHRRAAAYARGKFPGLEPDDVATRIGRLEELTGRSVDHRVFSKWLMTVEAR